MNKQAIVFGVVGIVIGAVLSGVIIASQMSTNAGNQITSGPSITETPEDSMANMDHNQVSMDQMSMGDMMTALQGKTGDDFDRTFIQAMISHHQGAIDMANAAKTSAKHQEMKDMADDIISTQTKEINQMREWQKEWGY